MLIPDDRVDEEPGILARIRGGERIEPYETIRQHKCGGRICIALTVSPILNRKGEVIGASKIARDTSDQRRAEEQRSLLLREMDHRIKNLFAISASFVRLSAQHANSADALAEDLLGRFSSLARAHSLTLDGEDLSNRKEINLHSLIREIVAPYHDKARAEENVTISGLNWTISASEVTSFALLFYEFVTNSAKHGALSKSGGRIHVECGETENAMCFVWSEYGIGNPILQTSESGFGSIFINATVERSLQGKLERSWNDNVLKLKITYPRKQGRLSFASPASSLEIELPL